MQSSGDAVPIADAAALGALADTSPSGAKIAYRHQLMTVSTAKC
jgi:hypothetical protein